MFSFSLHTKLFDGQSSISFRHFRRSKSTRDADERGAVHVCLVQTFHSPSHHRTTPTSNNNTNTRTHTPMSTNFQKHRIAFYRPKKQGKTNPFFIVFRCGVWCVRILSDLHCSFVWLFVCLFACLLLLLFG